VIERRIAGCTRIQITPAKGPQVAAEKGSPMKKTLLLTALAFTFLVAIPARAQAGCEDTPENPTLILAGLASGVYGATQLRTRMRARRASKNQ